MVWVWVWVWESWGASLTIDVERALRAGALPSALSALCTAKHISYGYAVAGTLGFKLTTQGRALMQFVDYCQAHHADHITADLALAWATDTPRSSDEVYWSRRLMVVRIFARHLQTLDPATEIPQPDVLPHHKRRITPYLYSPQEIAALLEAADTLAPPLRAATWRTLIGLLAVTGMRKSEACRLDRDHVDLNAATVVIEDSKFGKVPAAVPAPVHGRRVA